MSEETKNKTMEVVVHKAAVPLMKGESIEKFTGELSREGTEHCFKKLNMIKGKSGAWLVEAFGDAAVFSTYKSDEPSKYHVFKYTRNDKTGVFEFGDLTEVERVVGFRPKTTDMIDKVFMPGFVPSPKLPAKKPKRKPGDDLVAGSKTEKAQPGSVDKSCVCTKCGNVQKGEPGVQCTDTVCAKCGGAMLRKTEKEKPAEKVKKDFWGEIL